MDAEIMWLSGVSCPWSGRDCLVISYVEKNMAAIEIIDRPVVDEDASHLLERYLRQHFRYLCRSL
jgi:hypothetical protein